MMRILLFLATNMAVLIIASITLKLLGVDRFTGQNYGSLLVYCAVFGFAGSLISLFLSKWMAKMSTGTQIITQPRTRHEQWLMQTVAELARDAGIKMPEGGIFPAYESNAFATGWNKNDALVAVSQGLLERFSPDEVKAVLAHEIGHVANGDMDPGVDPGRGEHLRDVLRAHLRQLCRQGDPEKRRRPRYWLLRGDHFCRTCSGHSG